MVSTFSPAEERRILSLLMHVVIWTFTTAAAVTAVPGSILSLCEFRLHLTSMTFDQIVIAECNARNSAVDRTSYLCAQFSAAGRNLYAMLANVMLSISHAFCYFLMTEWMPAVPYRVPSLSSRMDHRGGLAPSSRCKSLQFRIECRTPSTADPWRLTRQRCSHRRTHGQ